MQRARRAGVDVPQTLVVDTVHHRIIMELVAGPTVKAFLTAAAAPDAAGAQPRRVVAPTLPGSVGSHESLTRATANAVRRELAERIGTGIARLHNAGIVHGDLTTSNMMLRAAPAAAEPALPAATQPSDASPLPAAAALPGLPSVSSSSAATACFPWSVVRRAARARPQQASVRVASGRKRRVTVSPLCASSTVTPGVH